MEDKIIIKSESYNVKKIFEYAWIVGIIAFIAVFLFYDLNMISYGIDRYNDIVEEYAEGSHVSSYEQDILDEYSSPLSFGLHCTDDGFGLGLQTLTSFGGTQIIAAVIYFWMKSYELTITDKRAYGFAAFGRRVDLPVDSITAIGLGWLKSIKITTASGRISFLLIKNRDQMYETISNLIVERQSKGTKTETVVKQETSNADELKKYKDLLDSGVITQEEFDQKKKQLLGL